MLLIKQDGSRARAGGAGGGGEKEVGVSTCAFVSGGGVCVSMNGEC